MRRYLLILILLSSCSQLPSTQPISREIASTDSCADLISIYFNINNHSASKQISADYLMRTGRITREDFQILKTPTVIDFLNSKDNQVEIAANLTLIKNKYKHFDEERVVRHYLFLENSCGI